MTKKKTRKKRYAFFLGCVTPFREASYEIASRRVCKELGIELVDMDGVNCCGLPIEAINRDMALSMAARNITIAEEKGLDIITICSGCAGALTKTNSVMKESSEVRDQINKYLKEIDREFKGTIKVKHFARVLLEDIGIEKLRKLIKRPLSGLRIAGHYGCHVLKPAAHMKFEDPENPTFLHELIELTGATDARYEGEKDCCGSMVIGVDTDVPLSQVRKKMNHVKDAGAQALVTICPSCHLMFDSNQEPAGKPFDETYNMPVLHYPQLLGLAMGIPPEELALDELKVKADEVLLAIEGLS